MTVDPQGKSPPAAKPISRFSKRDLTDAGITHPLNFVRWLVDQRFWAPRETRSPAEPWQQGVSLYHVDDLRHLIHRLGKTDLYELHRCWKLIRSIRSSCAEVDGFRVEGRYAVWIHEDGERSIERWIDFTGILKNGWIDTDDGERKQAAGNHIEYRRITTPPGEPHDTGISIHGLQESRQ